LERGSNFFFFFFFFLNHSFIKPKSTNLELTTTRESDYNQFFLEVIPVSPTRYRPPSKLGDQIFENPQNLHLTNILNANIRILEFYGNKTDKDGLPIDVKTYLLTYLFITKRY